MYIKKTNGFTLIRFAGLFLFTLSAALNVISTDLVDFYSRRTLRLSGNWRIFSDVSGFGELS